jgi:hypothetical protein
MSHMSQEFSYGAGHVPARIPSRPALAPARAGKNAAGQPVPHGRTAL